MQAVILAGGAGTRLRPLTLEVPKPMIDINGRPFLLYMVEELKKYGIKDFVFCIGYLVDKFKDFFGDGSKFGVNIKYSVEGEFLGTAGALKLAEKCLEDDFFVLNGDTYLPINYEKVYREFKRANKMGTIVLYDNSEKVAEENTAVDREGWVVAYGKKEPLKKGDQLIEVRVKEAADYKYIDAGVYVFKRGILNLIDKDKFVSLEGDIYPELIKSRELKGFITSQRYYDLGTPERLELIRRVLK
jgi:NDP-sugar pyrophosphorylase family protein